jgi:REP element-mobilizing transposase RayT
MKFDPNKHHRRSIRVAGYDYGAAGAYFVTVCVSRRRCAFGRIESGVMRLHPYGQIVAEQWEHSATLRAEIALDEWIVMPNHFHAIVWFIAPPSLDAAPIKPSEAALRGPSRVLGALINGFKGAVTREVNAHRAGCGLAPVAVWQRNYHERIIRDERELQEKRRYIIENPLHWENDEENPYPTR